MLLASDPLKSRILVRRLAVPWPLPTANCNKLPSATRCLPVPAAASVAATAVTLASRAWNLGVAARLESSMRRFVTVEPGTVPTPDPAS